MATAPDYTGNERKPGPKPLQSSSPRKQYLILYNFVSAILWTVVLGRVLLLVPFVGFGHVYGGVGIFAKFTQTLALLEVVHAATGLVRAPVLTTLIQISSRLILVWGTIHPFPFLAKSAWYSSMLIAWSITEVVRYSYFVCTLSGYDPQILTWLRYSMFYFLYPLGITSEYMNIWNAVKPAAAIRQEYAWILQLLMFIYWPLSYVMFTHMMGQRKKVLRAQQVQKME